MSFATLAVISLVAIVGPLLALPRHWHLPVILGELAAGIVLGTTGSVRLQARNETFTREKPDAGLARGRLRRSGKVRISSYFRIL
jgi:hypothetical protein